MVELLQLASNLGVGAFLATLIFIIYRIDRKSSEERLSKLLEGEQKSREENTRVQSELVTLIERLSGKLKQ